VYQENKIEAKILGVNEFGHLVLETKDGELVCDLKEISFVCDYGL
jgi:hypothetical protein